MATTGEGSGEWTRLRARAPTRRLPQRACKVRGNPARTQLLGAESSDKVFSENFKRRWWNVIRAELGRSCESLLLVSVGVGGGDGGAGISCSRQLVISHAAAAAVCGERETFAGFLI